MVGGAHFISNDGNGCLAGRAFRSRPLSWLFLTVLNPQTRKGWPCCGGGHAVTAQPILPSGRWTFQLVFVLLRGPHAQSLWHPWATLEEGTIWGHTYHSDTS